MPCWRAPRLNSINVGVGRFAQGITQTAGIGPVHTFMFATEPAIVRRVSGRMLGQGQIFHFRPDEQTATSSPRGMPWTFGIVLVPFAVLVEQGGAVAGFDLRLPLDDDRLFAVPGERLARLVALMHDGARLARDAPCMLDAAEPAAALGGSVLAALVACLVEGWPSPERAALRRHREIVARFEAALRQRPEEMLSLAAICIAAGAAERTLNLACREFLGQGAMQYARGRRLDLVRQRLMAGDTATVQVTEVAMRYGFWELGRFALAYRARFGERPSETLRRQPDRP